MSELSYLEFLERKRHSVQNSGIEPIFMPNGMFPFQEYVAEHLIRKGRDACFLDTGLGKTLIELVVATNYLRHTNKPVLIMTPLAVAGQMLKEATKFQIDDISYSKEGKFKSKIVICNYERLHYFNPEDFDCVICDESSILKNFEGAIKTQITAFIKKVKYRFLFTASPSPNDYIELGTSSEALGYLGYTDMLTKFFTNNEDTISPQNIGTKWLLKGHARKDFFRWVSSWSISARKPSDLGFDDSTHILPELITNYHPIKNESDFIVDGQYHLFNRPAVSHKEIRQEKRSTIEKRCEIAVELASEYDTSVYWCNLNDEGDLLEKLDKNSKQVSGSMSIEEKEEILGSFSSGQIKKLVTKGRITAFGLNWQHCGHTVYFPTFSFETYYQAIRRFWRFGRIDKVIADLVFSDGQQRELDSLIAKAKKADSLFSELNSALHHDFNIRNSEFDKKILQPSFL